MLESAVSRAQYIAGQVPPARALDYIKSILGDQLYFEEVEEVFVLRDIIAHNHVWDAKVYWDEDGALRLVSARLRSGHGDKKFRRSVDQNARSTKRLALNAFPTRICRRDALIVLRTVVKFLIFLEGQDRRNFALSVQPVEYKGELVSFVELVSTLK